jgi:hypothetical protein
VVEKGQRVRVLLTDLALDGSGGAGNDILYGAGTPSQVRFTARCYPAFSWSGASVKDAPVLIPTSQGAATHAVPAQQGINRVRIEVPFPPGAQRVTVTLTQTTDPNPAKDDVDMTLLDANGRALWTIGSPYSDESGTLWQDNLAPFEGHMTVQVDSYSAAAYQGHLSVIAEMARLPSAPS